MKKKRLLKQGIWKAENGNSILFHLSSLLSKVPIYAGWFKSSQSNWIPPFLSTFPSFRHKCERFHAFHLSSKWSSKKSYFHWSLIWWMENGCYIILSLKKNDMKPTLIVNNWTRHYFLSLSKNQVYLVDWKEKLKFS